MTSTSQDESDKYSSFISDMNSGLLDLRASFHSVAQETKTSYAEHRMRRSDFSSPLALISEVEKQLEEPSLLRKRHQMEIAMLEDEIHRKCRNREDICELFTSRHSLCRHDMTSSDRKQTGSLRIEADSLPRTFTSFKKRDTKSRNDRCNESFIVVHPEETSDTNTRRCLGTKRKALALISEENIVAKFHKDMANEQEKQKSARHKLMRSIGLASLWP